MENDEIVSNTSINNIQQNTESRSNYSESCVNYKDSINWLLHSLFVRKDFDECKQMIMRHSRDSIGTQSEYSVLLTALTKRFSGEINESLELLRKSYNNKEGDLSIMKEIGKNLILLGKFKMGCEIFDEVLLQCENDWESYYQKGICNMNLKIYDVAMGCLEKAWEFHSNEQILIAMGKLAVLQEDYSLAIEKYKDALSMSPDNPELISSIGALYLKLGNSEEAFEHFGKAMTYDSNFSNALLGVASIYQDKGEYEQSLIKYKIASVSNPNSPLVWNNLGLCFFAKQKFIAAVTCLKKAIYLDPFEWIIAYNLGLVYMHTKQYASAFHYMNCAANLKSDFYLIQMYLGVILSELGSINNAIASYDQSISLNENYLTYYNYTISLIHHEMYGNAKQKFKLFLELFEQPREEVSEHDSEIIENIPVIKNVLYGKADR